jgi:hypothetical protein
MIEAKQQCITRAQRNRLYFFVLDNALQVHRVGLVADAYKLQGRIGCLTLLETGLGHPPPLGKTYRRR